MAYNPDQRANDFQVQYVVNTTGDRWFIPYNDNDSKADQVTQCNKLAGHTADDSDVASELVAS
jgi:hypothetical protein